jgi:hypothetical protein
MPRKVNTPFRVVLIGVVLIARLLTSDGPIGWSGSDSSSEERLWLECPRRAHSVSSHYSHGRVVTPSLCQSTKSRFLSGSAGPRIKPYAKIHSLRQNSMDYNKSKRVFPRLDSGELYKQLESIEKQIIEACAPFGAGISAGFEDVLRGCRSTDGK